MFMFLSLLVDNVGVTPAQATASTQAIETPSLLQFTSGGHILGFYSTGMVAATGSHALRVDFVEAQQIQPEADSPASADGKAMPLNRVTYANLWPGVTLAYNASVGSIYTTTYSLAPGADAKNIRLHYNTPITLTNNGELIIAFETGSLTESAPIAWQDIEGKRVAVDVSFRVSGQEMSFELGAYNPHYPLTIDPDLTWYTFLGGSGSDIGYGIAVDGSGNVYVTGISLATWGSPIRAYTYGIDTFVAKLDPNGALLWNTFLGGNYDDNGRTIAVDKDGNVYVAGTDRGIWGSPVRDYTPSANGHYEAFAVKLDSSGVLQWSTFLGGNGDDGGSAIVIDENGNIYVVGYSDAAWGCLPISCTVRAYTNVLDAYDAFVAKLDSNGVLQWNTFLGGTGSDSGSDIGMDADGNIYVGGYSTATWGAPIRAFIHDDSFVAKLDSDGALQWNTFLGGSDTDSGSAIALDGVGNIYVAGTSYATWGIPLRAYNNGTSTPNTNRDAFVAKLNSSGVLQWNTFLGGSGADWGTDIIMNSSGNAYVTGYSSATWGAPVAVFKGGYSDAFIVKLNSNGELGWNTFLGGTGEDVGMAITVDASNNVYLTGYSSGTWDSSPVHPFTGFNDAFVSVMGNDPTVTSIIRANPNPTSAASVDFTVTFSEAVTGVDTSDFNLTIIGISDAAVSAVSGSGAVYTVTVETGTGAAPGSG
jgi:hypothetical protein